MILAAAVLAAIVTAPPPDATLCVEGICRAASETRVEVAPAEAVRTFVWISPESSRAVLGTIPAGATIVPLANDGEVAHTLTLATSDGSRNVAAGFEVRCSDKVWKWSLPRIPRQAINVFHPPGSCTLALRAEGYKPVEKELAAPKLGVLYLHRLPVISGTVTDSTTSAPVARAELFLPGGTSLATTDATGRFRVAIDGPWPSHLRIEASQHAPRTIAVPKAVADADLPITMSVGGSVQLTLAPPLGREAVRWELRRVIRGIEDENVRSGEAAAGESTVTIERVDPGSYRIVVSGDGPLQRVAIPVAVQEAVVVEATAQISPTRLELEVLRGSKPLAGAEVEMIFSEGAAAWRSTFAVDELGRAVEELWQPGQYWALVGLSDDRRRVAGGESIAWTLNVSERVIRGSVTDAGTGKPVAGAIVLLDAAPAGGRGMQTATRTEADGVFEFKAVPAGSFALAVRAQGYEEAAIPRATLEEDAHLTTRDVRLRPVTGRVLRVVNGAGVPMPEALVWIASRYGIRAAGVTREDGRLTLPLAADEAGDAYVLPRSGSFAVTRFASMTEAGAEDLVVTVPDGTASLEMHAVSTDGEPIPGVPFLMRVNGTLLPLQVYEDMVQHQGLPLSSDASGKVLLARLPPGRYEIWPLTSPQDRRAVASANPPPAPVNVMLTPGHHVAKLTFKPKA